MAEEDKRECLECWCKDKKDHGSFFCCKDCPAKDGPAVDYRLEYTVTYRCYYLLLWAQSSHLIYVVANMALCLDRNT